MSDNLQNAPITACFGKAVVSAGTTTTLTLAPSPAPLVYAIRSKLYNKAAASNAATPTVDVTTKAAFKPIPINSGSVFLIGLDAAGNLRVSQGSIEAVDVGNAFVLPPQFPVLDDTCCPIAYMLVKVGPTGAPWTFGASNNSGATGVTYVFQDVAMTPDRPQVS